MTATYRTDERGIPTQASGGSTQPFAYTGEPRDGTGLTYLRARYYDPALGRFTSRDTWPGSAGSPTTLNRYAYVGDNPTTRTDPSGHCFVDTVADVAFLGWDVISLLFGPPKERGANLTAFGLDLVGAAIPCATGLGFAYGGMRWVGRGTGRSIAHFTLDSILDARRLEHLFQANHNLDRLGSQAQAIDKIVKAVFAADADRLIPAAGPFEIRTTIDGFATEIHGAIVNGELRISDAWIP